MTTRDEADEAESEDVTTFRMVAIAALAPRDEHRTGPRAEPTALQITRTNFGEVMSALASSFVVDVDDPFDASAAPLRVDVRIEDLKSFRPDGLIDASAPLRALAEARRLLEEAPRAGRNEAELRAHLARVLPRPEWARHLLGSPSPSPSPARASATGEAPKDNVPAPAVAIDSILDMVDAGSTPPAAPSGEADPIAALVSAVAKSARPPAARATTASPNTASAAMARLLGSLIGHPEIHRLEQLWRSVRLLVDHAPSNSGVEIYVIAASGDEARATLDAITESDAGGFDIIILGDVLSATAVDLALAKHAASVGEAIQAAVLVSGTPALVGAKDLAGIGRSSRKLSAVDDPRAVAARAAGADEAMRWLFVALNGPLVRAPWSAETSRVRGLTFAEDASDESRWIAALPAFALAALCAKSCARHGWPTPVTAPDVMLENLVVREAHDGGVTAALPVEAFVSDDAARELAQAGLVIFGGIPNRDSAYVRFAPCFHRPAGPAAKGAEGSLADALFVGTLVRTLRELMAAIPAGVPAAKIEHAATVIVRDLLERVARPGGAPEIDARVKGEQLHVLVRPHRFAGVTLEEVALEVPLQA